MQMEKAFEVNKEIREAVCVWPNFFFTTNKQTNKTGSHVSHTDFNLTVDDVELLILLNSRITVMYHHFLFKWCWGLNH